MTEREAAARAAVIQKLARSSVTSWGGRIADWEGEPGPDDIATVDTLIAIVREEPLAEVEKPCRVTHFVGITNCWECSMCRDEPCERCVRTARAKEEAKP